MKKLLIAFLMMSPLFAADAEKVIFSGTQFERVDCLRESTGGKSWMQKNVAGKKLTVLRVGSENYEIFFNGVFASSCRYVSVTTEK
jgi:hypothetical protein